eukprot:4020426-Karenia_brevis.AAC.1
MFCQRSATRTEWKVVDFVRWRHLLRGDLFGCSSHGSSSVVDLFLPTLVEIVHFEDDTVPDDK